MNHASLDTRRPRATPARIAPDALPPALDGAEGDIDILHAGRVHYYADRGRDDRPILLVHSIHAAASAREMRPLFEALRGRRRVFAIDLPGFGLSARDDRRYTPEVYADAIERAIVDVAAPQGGGCDVVALSLSAEFAARVALRAPEIVRRLVLLSPTGLSSRRASPAAAALRARVIGPLVHRGLVGRGLFALLRTETSVRHFLGRSFVGPVDEGMVQYALRAARVPGAEHAPLDFLSGGMFCADAFERLYAPLRVPTTVVYDRDPYTDFGRLAELVACNEDVRAARVAPSLGMAHAERTDAVVDLIEPSPIQRGAG